MERKLLKNIVLVVLIVIVSTLHPKCYAQVISFNSVAGVNDSRRLIESHKPDTSLVDGYLSVLMTNYGPDTISQLVLPQNYRSLKANIRSGHETYWKTNKKFGTVAEQVSVIFMAMSANYQSDTAKTFGNCLYLSDEAYRLGLIDISKSWLDSVLLVSKSFEDTVLVLIRLGCEVMNDSVRVENILGTNLSASDFTKVVSLYYKPHYVVDLYPKILSQRMFDQYCFHFINKGLTFIDVWRLLSKVKGYENPFLNIASSKEELAYKKNAEKELVHSRK